MVCACVHTHRLSDIGRRPTDAMASPHISIATPDLPPQRNSTTPRFTPFMTDLEPVIAGASPPPAAAVAAAAAAAALRNLRRIAATVGR